MPADDIRLLVDDLVSRRETLTSRELAEAAGISRQAAQGWLRRGVEEGWLRAEGAARATRYRRAEPRFVFARAGLEEDRVWDTVQQRVPGMSTLAGDDRAAVAYAFTEMVNNAIDHSGAEHVAVSVDLAPERVTFRIEDDGVGAFEHFRTQTGLGDPIEAIQEISKGKATTDPARHTGEGIFFTSKVASRFELHAGALRWVVDNALQDTAILEAPPRRGTSVTVVIARPVPRPLAEVFAEYAGDLAFDRTRTVVKLFAVGRDFVSRSEARRLLHGLERFREVVVDFARVDGIGQGFADEIFRVWAHAHPEVRLIPENMNAAVAFMVRRALA